MIRRLLIAFLLLQWAAAATSKTIALGPEHPVAPLSSASDAPYVNRGVSLIASDGRSFLVAWTASYSKGRGAILTASLDAEATVRSTSALPYEVDADIVSLAWTGDSYRIVWRDRADEAIVAADVDGDGKLVHPRAVIVPPHTARSVIAVAFSGDRTLVTYVSLTGSDNAIIVGAGGATVRAEFPVTEVIINAGPTAVTADDRGFAFFWLSEGPAFTATLYARHITRDGIPDSAPARIAGVGVSSEIAAAYNAGHFAVSFVENVVAAGTNKVTSTDVRRFIVSPSWEVVELPPIAIPYPQLVLTMHVIPDGGGFLAHWRAADALFNLQTVRFDANDPGVVDSRYVYMLPAVDVSLAAGGNVVGVDGNMAGFVLDRAPPGVTPPANPVARFPVAQVPRGVASIGTQSLVVWSEIDLSNRNLLVQTVFAMRVDADGGIIDREPLVVGSMSSTSGVVEPGVAVVAAGSRYWIAWATGPLNGTPTVMLRGISPDGTMTDVQATPFRDATLATNGSVILLAGNTTSLAVARYSVSGIPIDVVPIRLASNGSSFTPRAAWNGEAFLVAWTEVVQECTRFCPVPYTKSRVMAARISGAGFALDPAPIAVTSFQTYVDKLLFADVASDGRDFLVTYNQGGVAMAKRVLHEGTLADFDAGSVIDATASIAAVRPLSGGYVTFSSPAGADAPFETHVLRFDELGNPVDSVGTFPGRTVGASLRSDGAYLIVYSRPADSREAAGATQVFTRLLSPASSRTRAVQH